MKTPKSPLLFLSVLAAVSCTNLEVKTLRPQNLKQESTIKIGSENLRMVFADNTAYGTIHKAGYNGISELYHRDQDSTIFVQDYAGFNLEHIFGGDSLIELFEPRLSPMELYRKSDNEILLYQASTPISGVESLTQFTLSEPNYLDVEFQCIFHNTEFFQHGYAGLFWASYIQHPMDKRIYFPGTAEGKQGNTLIEAYSSEHGLASTHRALEDKNDFFYAENFNASLASNYSEYRYQYPYYFGRFKNMALAFLFSSKNIIRFSQSPTGGGSTNPAWDFHHIIPSPEDGKVYSFKARIIYKPSVDAEDIRAEYKSWNALNK